ncbi:Hypothetical protein A7982_07973 [Minicystis rosea]|nr:Hypothetical protein A7982_07973 [Minicystis rosea]
MSAEVNQSQRVIRDCAGIHLPPASRPSVTPPDRIATVPGEGARDLAGVCVDLAGAGGLGGE